MEETIITSWFQCTACSNPCFPVNLSTGRQSLCCDALVEEKHNQPVLRSKLPPSHPDALKPQPATRWTGGD